jgi:hypothetical protein
MSEMDLEKRVRERHVEVDMADAGGRNYCDKCLQISPCDAIQLAEEVERLEKANTGLIAASAHWHQRVLSRISDNDALSEENARLREEISECAQLIPIWGSLPDRIRFLLRMPRSIEDGAIDYPRLMVEQNAENARLREALEKIREEVADPCGQPTLDNIDETARAALPKDEQPK